MSYKIIFAKMQKCKTFRNTLNINALSKHKNQSFFAFPAFCPQKTAILGIFDCYFRVSDARKSDLDARKPALDGWKPRLRTPTPFWEGQNRAWNKWLSEHKKTAQNGIFNVHFGLTSAFETNKTALLRCHETPLLAIETRIFLTSSIFPLSSQPRGNFRRGKGKNFSLRSKKWGIKPRKAMFWIKIDK